MYKMTEEKHIKLSLGSDYKMVVISDIHGHLSTFKNLLREVNLKEEDYLVILGDFINRGPESLAVLNEIVSLLKRPNTYILKGNHEKFLTSYVQSEKDFPELLTFLQERPYEVLFHDMAEQLKFDIWACQSPEDFRQKLLCTYSFEIDFMEQLPILLETESFIFVHGGYEKQFSIEIDENKYLKYDFFNERSPVQEKTVIVGHWPACNLRSDSLSNTPFFNVEKNIITIDGGLGVKDTGQLNAFIMTSDNGVISYETLQVSPF